MDQIPQSDTTRSFRWWVTYLFLVFVLANGGIVLLGGWAWLQNPGFYASIGALSLLLWRSWHEHKSSKL